MIVRLIRLVLGIEGLIMSWKTYESTRKLEARQEEGDHSVDDAVALTLQGRLFDIPNGISASAYFALMIVLSATGLIDRAPVRRVALALAWISLGVSGYLVYQLLFVMKRQCPLCMRAHTLNLAFTLALTAQVARQEHQDH